MDAGSATDGQKILARAIYNKIMKLAGEAGLADDIDDYMKMHLDSIEKGDPIKAVPKPRLQKKETDINGRGCCEELKK